ncbi:MAG: DUF1294 domain-containing protein [Candidatus Methanoplasma sp.]|jgi:uncharacterized membrane protein YsdA (DUF1294 family)|nr:DUF1294 domain-containing protein [Candidatus Methanoplasma sp.]
MTPWEWQLALCAILALNLASLCAYGFDKRRAVTGGRRVSERALLAVALIAPFGAVGGMRAFRHKTRKAKFKLAYLFLLAHLIVAALILT